MLVNLLRVLSVKVVRLRTHLVLVLTVESSLVVLWIVDRVSVEVWNILACVLG